jgi:ABC-type multidrug transport system fused ATPase/permease subunit
MNISLITKPLQSSSKLGISKKSLFIMLFLYLAKIFFELVSIGLLLPVFQFLEHQGNIEVLLNKAIYWKYILSCTDFLNLELSLGFLLIIVFIMLLQRQLFGYLNMTYQGKKKTQAEKHVFDKGLKSVLNSQLSYFDNSNRGSIVNDLTTESNKCIIGIIKIVQFLGLVVLLFSYIIMLIIVSKQGVFVIVLVMALCLCPFIPMIKKSKIIGKKVTFLNQSIVSIIINSIDSLRLIRLSGNNLNEINKLKNLTQKLRVNQMLLIKIKALIAHSLEPIVVGIGLGFIYITISYYSFSLGELGIMAVVALRLLPVVKDLIAGIQSIAMVNASVEAVLKRLLDLSKCDENTDAGENIKIKLGEIIFQDISFSYSKANKKVLKTINLKVKSGKITALVGPSGTGKSTLIDLIPRLREPNSGSIKIDGFALNNFNKNVLRRQIGYLSQNAEFLGHTIKDHIQYGLDNKNDEKMRQAAKLAGASQFIKNFPDEYDAIISEGGSNLSAGQKQRLDLARVLMRNTPIIILDEPTSNLDPENARSFIKQLNYIKENKQVTIIIISHNAEAVRELDNIVVMENGTISDIGNHQELCARDNWYKSSFIDR